MLHKTIICKRGVLHQGQGAKSCGLQPRVPNKYPVTKYAGVIEFFRDFFSPLFYIQPLHRRHSPLPPLQANWIAHPVFISTLKPSIALRCASFGFLSFLWLCDIFPLNLIGVRLCFASAKFVHKSVTTEPVLLWPLPGKPDMLSFQFVSLLWLN